MLNKATQMDVEEASASSKKKLNNVKSGKDQSGSGNKTLNRSILNSLSLGDRGCEHGGALQQAKRL